MNKIKKMINNPKVAFDHFMRLPWSHLLSDEMYVKIRFRVDMKKKLDLINPRMFSEKLQWLKLYDRKPIYTTMVDKYEAKRYVASLIGEKYIIPTLGVWEHFEDIDFGQLPNQFVLKCTHDSGGVYICKDKSKLDVDSVKKKINKSLRKNYFYNEREWPYKDVKPRIIAEQYLVTAGESGLNDYKIFCFHGEPKFILVCSNRFSKSGLNEDFFDVDWKHLELARKLHGNAAITPARPNNLQEMIELSRKIAENTKFLRVDLYETNNEILFGECTFYPTSGFEEFSPAGADYEIGELLNIAE